MIKKNIHGPIMGSTRSENNFGGSPNKSEIISLEEHFAQFHGLSLTNYFITMQEDYTYQGSFNSNLG